MPTDPLPPAERHNDPRQVLIDTLDRHQKRDIKSCDCGTWGSDHGHLGQRHSVHVADVALAELAASGLWIWSKPDAAGRGMLREAFEAGKTRQRYGDEAHDFDAWYAAFFGEDNTDAD